MRLNSWRSIVTAKSVESAFVNEYYYKESAPSRELASFLIVILPFSRVHSVCISCALHLFFVHTGLQIFI